MADHGESIALMNEIHAMHRLFPVIFATALAGLAIFLGIPSANAQTQLSTADKNFISAAAQGGLTEVKLGELAAQRGTRADVQAFGVMMAADYTAMNSDLKALAVLKGTTLPYSLDADRQEMVARMAAMSGAAFDDAYISTMINEHAEEAKTFKAQSAQTKDGDIDSFLAKFIPIVAEHLKHITEMKQ
jgi:putative membrane protein